MLSVVMEVTVPSWPGPVCDYADTLRDRDAEGDRISSELGMPPLMERVLSRREILKA